LRFKFCCVGVAPPLYLFSSSGGSWHIMNYENKCGNGDECGPASEMRGMKSFVLI
jgi:hypothetical protein